MTLSIENLCLSYGKKPVLSNISLTLKEAKLLAIMGPSGSGKSSLAQAILGIHKGLHITGRIGFAGTCLQDSQTVMEDIGKRQFSYVPQHLGLWPHCSVQKTLELTRSFSKERTFIGIDAMLAHLSLLDLRDKLPHQLSRGQQQRLALGRALINRPKLLILDEPFSALDIITRQSLLRLVKNLLSATDICTMLITHDLREAQFLCDDLMILYDGKKAWHGPTNHFKDEIAEWPLLSAHRFFYEHTLGHVHV